MRPRPTDLLLLTAALVVSAGCGGRDSLNDVYGRRSGAGAGSINGASALGEMFKQAGHRVRSWRHLSPSLKEADVIVWFPAKDEIVPGAGYQAVVDAPSEEAVAWLGDWLQFSEGSKTLIYVGRDWEAGPEYWAGTQAAAPAAQRAEFAAELREAITEEQERLTAKADRDASDWLRIERGAAKTSVKKLVGPMAEGIDAAEAGLVHWSGVHMQMEADTLLADGQGSPLVSEVVYDASQVDWTDQDSRLIVVENAGFLVNGALVNHERRKLAGRLIDRVGPPGQRVVFLEAGPDPPVRETDPNPRPPTGLELFGIWPVGAVLAQVAALFVVYAASRWPIFGVPRRLRDPSLTDFGRHVHALARLLAATRDRSYAVTQLNQYFRVGATTTRENAAPGAGSRRPPPNRNP